jgi:hypothetical protein
MHLLLFEGPTHLLSQFIKKLPDGAVVKVAGILRQYLAREDSHLPVARGFTSRIGILRT